MLNKEISKEKLKKLKLLVLDSDGVLIHRGTKIFEYERGNSYRVNFTTEKISNKIATKINSLKKKMLICVSSGRSLIYLQTIYSKIIGEGTILQAENGNISLISGKIVQHFEYPESYFKKLALIREDIKKLPISGFEPKQLILTIHSNKELPRVYDIVKKHDPDNTLKVMWNGEAFDIQDKRISKGEGLQKLISHLKLKNDEVIAIGDRVNDKELLEVAGIGVSADQKILPVKYWTLGEELGGEVLVDYLFEKR